MKIHTILIVSLSLSSISCYSYIVFPPEYRELAAPSVRTDALVVNPTLAFEMQVLQKSAVFNIVSDANTPKRIRLYKLDTLKAGGNSISPGLELTLGLIPMYAPDRYIFEFDELTSSDSIHRVYELKVARRVSLYDFFIPKGELDERLSLSLRGEFANSTR